MKYLLGTAAAAALAVLPMSPASAAGNPNTGCAENWFHVEVGDVVEGIPLPDYLAEPKYDHNQDGVLCAMIVPAPEQEFSNPNALGAVIINVVDNRQGKA
jgi:hypothetical protein